MTTTRLAPGEQSDPVTYTAVLPVPEETVLFVSSLLAAEQRRRRTRRRRRALGCYPQAVLVLRWFVDGIRWSGKHARHGGNMQVIAAPDGCPLWASGVRPGREHDTTALRAHPQALPLLGEWTDDEHAVLADLGYEGERAALTTPIKHAAGHRLTDDPDPNQQVPRTRCTGAARVSSSTNSTGRCLNLLR